MHHRPSPSPSIIPLNEELERSWRILQEWRRTSTVSCVTQGAFPRTPAPGLMATERASSIIRIGRIDPVGRNGAAVKRMACRRGGRRVDDACLTAASLKDRSLKNPPRWHQRDPSHGRDIYYRSLKRAEGGGKSGEKKNGQECNNRPRIGE